MTSLNRSRSSITTHADGSSLPRATTSATCRSNSVRAGRLVSASWRASNSSRSCNMPRRRLTVNCSAMLFTRATSSRPNRAWMLRSTTTSTAKVAPSSMIGAISTPGTVDSTWIPSSRRRAGPTTWTSPAASSPSHPGSLAVRGRATPTVPSTCTIAPSGPNRTRAAATPRVNRTTSDTAVSPISLRSSVPPTRPANPCTASRSRSS